MPSVFSDIIDAQVFNNSNRQTTKIITEEFLTIDTVKKVGPSVVTVVGTFKNQSDRQEDKPTQTIDSGFIVSSKGLVITSRHVVSDKKASYQIITADNVKYKVNNIYRDPRNDIAVLKVDPSQNFGKKLEEVALGDSSNLQVGQFVIAIGTVLGEFRNTVTTGVISGLGRGITAGDEFQNEIENLNDVIQTSAAINPGNSGGPLINDSNEVIGINTAVAQSGQNIGFALPVNVVKSTLAKYNSSNR